MRGSEFAQLKAFATVAEMGSFSRAAAALRISRSALSQTIRNLEETLGVPLLNRTTRSISPTEAGSRLLARFIPAMAEIDQAVEAARSLAGIPAGTLRVHAQRLGHDLFLRPILGVFAEAYPAITLDITLDDSVIDIVANGFDAGIRLGDLLDQDMVALKLGTELRQLAVASPAYLAAHGRPRTPEELLSHRCIGFRWAGQGAVYNWEFRNDGNWFAIAIRPTLLINDQRAGVLAALDGAGIAFWVESEVRPFIKAGRLVALLEEWSSPFPGFFLYFPRQRQRSAALRAFVDLMRARFAGKPPDQMIVP